METHPDDRWDWRRNWAGPHDGLVLGLLALQSEIDDDATSPGTYAALAREAQAITDADDAFATYIDPGVGASGYGIGFLLVFLGVGADVIAWGSAAYALAPRLKKLIASLNARPDVFSIELLPDALQVLVTAEVIGRSGLRPQAVDVVHRHVFDRQAPEPRSELRQLDSCCVFILSADTQDHYQQVWTYVVTSTGRVVSDSLVERPLVPVSLWKDEIREHRFLSGL